MSYNQGHGQNPQQGYGQYNPYGQQNPYDQRGDNQSPRNYNSPPQAYSQGNPYAQQDDYGQQRPAYQQTSSSRYDEEQAQGGYEMGAVGGRGGNDPNRILNEVRAIDAEMNEADSALERLKGLRTQNLNEIEQTPDSKLNKEIDGLNADIINTYKALTARVQTIKGNPESGNPRNAPQVGRVDRALKAALSKAQRLDKEHREQQREMIRRQYLIVRPDASEQEIREVQEDLYSQQIFSQALINSDRRGNAREVSNNVKARHEAIAKIEQDIITLSQLFNDLETAVVQQEAQVATIEDKADVAQEHVTQATVQLDGAIVKAKAARKKKWICLGIVVLIIIIVVAVAVGVVEANKRP